MSEPQTLQFENARVLATLFANDLTLLKQLETALDVRVTTREGWLRVEGEAERFEQVRRVFAQLERARVSLGRIVYPQAVVFIGQESL